MIIMGMYIDLAETGANALLALGLGLSLWRGLRPSKRVQRHSALRRLVQDWRWRRAVARMPQLDDFGRPVAS